MRIKQTKNERAGRTNYYRTTSLLRYNKLFSSNGVCVYRQFFLNEKLGVQSQQNTSDRSIYVAARRRKDIVRAVFSFNWQIQYFICDLLSESYTSSKLSSHTKVPESLSRQMLQSSITQYRRTNLKHLHLIKLKAAIEIMYILMLQSNVHILA